jgi:hypothetical protein
MAYGIVNDWQRERVLVRLDEPLEDVTSKGED